MSKNIEDKEGNWTIAVGFYPGILFGVRTYKGTTHTQIVFYLPFTDLALEWEN